MTSGSRRTHHQVTFAVLAVGVLAYALLQSLVVPVLTTVQEQLHTSQANATWVLTAYLLSASIFTPIMGRIGDMIGKEKVLVATLVALTLGSLLAAVAPNLGIMIIARCIQGVGGGVLPLSFGIIRDEFPREKVTGAVGIIAALVAVGGGLGIVLAGPIVDALSWHWLFWIPMIATAITAGLTMVFIPESPVRTPGRISWLPALLMAAWLVVFLLPLSEASSWGWGSFKVIGLIILAVILAVLWVVAETKSASPLIDMTMMRRRAVWTNNLAGFLIGFGMYAFMAFLPEFVQTPRAAGYGFGASITRSGLMMLPSTVTMFLVSIMAGRLAIRFGGKTLVVVGGLVAAIGTGVIALAHGSQWEMYLATGIIGIGIGLAFSAMSGLIVAAVPAEQVGVASGMNANIRTIGGSVGSAIMASVVAAKVTAGGLPAGSGYTHGFLMLAGGFVISAIAGVLIPSLKVRPATSDRDEPHAELGLVAGGTLVGDESE